MTTNTRISIIVTVAVAAIVTLVVTLLLIKPFGQKEPQGESAAPPSALAADSHILDTAEDDAVTIVEFLDFECESCRAVYPFVEQLRDEYAGRITFAIRYFPVPAHRNSMTAALAVEAASKQGKLEEMYGVLFETQEEWGERQDSQAPLIRGYAEQLGLDMARFDADVADPATEERVQADFDAGRALGVTGTPTFFLNDEMLSLTSPDDFVAAVEAALAR